MADSPYIPEVIDTSAVQLSSEVVRLKEELSRHIHGVWALGRINDDWTYGPHRNDEKKQHPGLVPYDQLSESEKNYDRNTSTQTLKAILKLGYQILPPNQAAESSVWTSSDKMLEYFKNLQNSGQLSLLELFARFYEQQEEQFWKSDPKFHMAFAKKLISAGHASAAFDYANRALEYLQGHLGIRYYRVLALARGRNINLAHTQIQILLDELKKTPPNDIRIQEDLLSLAGRIYKDMAIAAKTTELKATYYNTSQSMYYRAYQLQNNWYPGINAATMAMLAEDSDEHAKALAIAVIKLIDKQQQQNPDENDYWLLATLGEAHLLLHDEQTAKDYYQKAVGLAENRIGDIVSMRRNVDLLNQKKMISPLVRDIFNIGNIAAFSGHMVDHPLRTTKHQLSVRFPENSELENRLRQQIDDHIQTHNISVGYASAACGSDIIFCEQILKHGKELNVILPFEIHDFFQTSVDFGYRKRGHWRKRCEQILKQATVTYATKERFLGDEVLFEFTNRLTQGMAILRAQDYGISPIAITVLEQSAVAKPAGTHSFLHGWEQEKREAYVIDLGALREKLPESMSGKSSENRQQDMQEDMQVDLVKKVVEQKDDDQVDMQLTGYDLKIASEKRRIRFMLFSDVKNFSKLKEENALAFFAHFMEIAEGVLTQTNAKPIFKNTWGDALYFVFDTATACADLAMGLLEKIQNIDWETHDLPADTTMRIGLHAGPVYQRMNKIIGKPDFFGSHVNLAARIEPVATPGSAFVSAHFAAELALERGDNFVCEYMGITELPKRCGSLPLYRLDRR